MSRGRLTGPHGVQADAGGARSAVLRAVRHRCGDDGLRVAVFAVPPRGLGYFICSSTTLSVLTNLPSTLGGWPLRIASSPLAP